MKKLICLIGALLLIGASPALCGLSATVDGFIDNRMNSDIRPVEDAGRILDMTNRGIDKTYHVVTDPMKPMLDPVRRVRDETLKGSKSIVNTVWDTVTLRRFRN